MTKIQEETSSLFDHGGNEEQETSANVENPRSEGMQEVSAKDDESTENVENREETTMEDTQRLLQLHFVRACVASVAELYEKQLVAIDEGDVETSRVREVVSAYRAVHFFLFEMIKKMREEACISSSHGGNEEQESTENVEKCAGNENKDQDLGENGKNQEEERKTKNAENPEENPVINMEERGREEAGFSLKMEEFPTLDDASLVPYRRGRR